MVLSEKVDPTLPSLPSLEPARKRGRPRKTGLTAEKVKQQLEKIDTDEDTIKSIAALVLAVGQIFPRFGWEPITQPEAMGIAIPANLCMLKYGLADLPPEIALIGAVGAVVVPRMLIADARKKAHKTSGDSGIREKREREEFMGSRMDQNVAQEIQPTCDPRSDDGASRSDSGQEQFFDGAV